MKTYLKNLNFYFDNTTLHGFSYISGRRHWIEKLFWISAFLSSFICCLLLFNKLILKVNKNPIIIDRPDIAIPIKNIPFPAISVCPGSIQSGSTEILSVLYEIKYPSVIFDINSRCKLMWVYMDCRKNDMHWKRFELAVPYLLPLHVNWAEKFNASTILTLTHFGWCKTFNIVENDEMFNKNLISNRFKHQVMVNSTSKIRNIPPYYTSKRKAGYSGYIRTNLKLLPFCEFSWGCNHESVKTTVIVHSPYEMPDIRHKRFVIEYLDFAKISIEAQIKITDSSLLSLDVDERRCYKPNEHQLQYFKTYTSINCLKECESSFILQKCGCVPYYFINNDTSLICSTTQLDCFNREYEKFDEVKCKCYPPCEEIGYEYVATNMNAAWTTKVQNIESIISIIAKFKADSFYPQIRKKYFTMIDWFSFVGGILGLFFGFSFLSAFEVVFHIWRGFFGKQNTTLSGFRIKYVEKLTKYLRSFLESSSIHGLRYIPNKSVKIYERIAWITSFTLSITACTYMIRELHQKLTIDSISIALSNKFMNLSEIPFPAITITGTNLIDIFSEAEYPGDPIVLNGQPLDYVKSWDLKFMVSDIWSSTQKRNFTIMHSSRNYVNLTNYSHLITPILKDFWKTLQYEKLADFSWDDDYKVPTALVLTSMSYGYSFNIIPSEHMFYIDQISDDFIYSYKNYFKSGNKSKLSTFPWKSPYKNQEVLDFTLPHMYYPPFFYIHSPYDYPTRFEKDDVNAFEMKFSASYEILIIPEIVTTNEDLKSLPLSQRLCFMDGEVKLKFFKIYTQRNCELECLSEKLLKSCNCIPFDVIRSNKTNICELYDYICIDKVQELMRDHEHDSNHCKCLQPCNSISYNFEFIDTKHDEELGSGIKFRFKDNEFVAMERIRQFTIFDFLSYIGGLLGLFAGISVLSIFEIFYFFSLRLICEILRVKRSQRRVTFKIVVPKAIE